MGKNQGKKHIFSRISFLYQAATYLSAASRPSSSCTSALIAEGDVRGTAEAGSIRASSVDHEDQNTQPGSREIHEGSTPQNSSTAGLSRLYVSQLRSISRKAVIRLAPEMKHTICKGCDALLRPGLTSTVQVENASRRKRKPHADVLVISCDTCGAVKRFPVGAKRQQSKGTRVARSKGNAQEMVLDTQPKDRSKK